MIKHYYCSLEQLMNNISIKQLPLKNTVQAPQQIKLRMIVTKPLLECHKSSFLNSADQVSLHIIVVD